MNNYQENKFKNKVVNLLKEEGLVVVSDKFSSYYLKRYKFEPKTVFDIGVCRGTPELYSAFPNCKIVLIDPLEESRDYYKSFSQDFCMEFLRCAVGSSLGTIEIKTPKNKLALTSVLERTNLTNQKDENVVTKVKIETLDNIIKQNEYQSPYGIKIDTEGYELEVLKGMTESMADIEFIIAEVSVKKRFINSYDFSEVVSLLSKYNFELIDILNNTIDSPRFFDCLFVNKQSFRFSSDMENF